MSFTQINVQHPAAKSMIEVARTQDEEVGDGTTSVIILGKRFNVNNHQLSLTEGNTFPMHLWLVDEKLER